MLKSREFLFCLLLALAGCSTTPRKTETPAPTDWGEMETKPPVAEFQPLPKPATNTAQLPRTNYSVETWVSVARWAQAHHSSLLRTALVPLPAFSLASSNGVFIFHTGSTAANWDGMEFHLAFPPQSVNGQPFIRALEFEKNIAPLFEGFQPLEKTNRVIVIDPGHGGINAGAPSVLGRVYEKDFTLDWARRLAPLLETNGWQVFLTRTNDLDVPLSNRVAFAEMHKADLFLSLHFNSAAPNQQQAGLETFCLTPAGMLSTLTRGYEDNASQVFPNNAFDRENLQYAFRLHRALLRTNGGLDRGVRHARFMGVLLGQNRPAVLIEGGYLSNPKEARRIADPEFRQKLAEAIASALTQPAETNVLAQTKNVFLP